MFVKKILIELAVEEKIFKKHGIKRKESEEMFLLDKLKCFRAKKKRYLAVGSANRFVTIVFEYCKGNATVVTAYPSLEWQKGF